MADTHIAELMWDAYASQAGGKTFDGKPLPTWDELGEERQFCWVAAASVAADRIEKLEAALREILLELSDKDAPSWLGHGVMAMIATNALAGKKEDDAP